MDGDNLASDVLDPFELPEPAPSEQKRVQGFDKATRTAFVTVRALPSEKIRLRAAAKRAGYRDTSSWARGVLLAAATGDDAPRLDDGVATEIARLRRDLNSGIGSNLNQALLHANTNVRAGTAIDEAALATIVSEARDVLEGLRSDLQQALKPHGRR